MTDELLFALARTLLRVCSPLRAYSILARLGALLPPRGHLSDVRRAQARVQGRGTCLSRAFAVAARAPSAEVVIGVAPRAGQPLLAHAWLEMSGQATDPSDVIGSVIARIRSPSIRDARCGDR